MVEASPRLFRTKGWVEPRDVPTSPRRIGGFWRRWPFGRWPFGRWPARRARRVSAGGLALVDEVIASLADSGRLAAGLLESATRRAAAPGGAARAGKEQAQPEQGDGPDHHAVEEQRAVGAGHVVAEHREAVGERMRAATVAENTGHADDHRGDQDDEPKNDDHDALRRLRRRPTILGQAQLPAADARVLRSARAPRQHPGRPPTGSQPGRSCRPEPGSAPCARRVGRRWPGKPSDGWLCGTPTKGVTAPFAPPPPSEHDLCQLETLTVSTDDVHPLVAVVAVAVILTRSPRARRALRPAVRAARGLFHVEITSGAVDVGTVELDLPVREVVALGVRTGPPVGGVALSHSAWQPCHRQRPSAILNLEGDAMCTCRHSADAHHHWQRLDSTACSKCDCPRWQRPRSPVLQDPPSPLSQRLLGVTFMRPPGVSWS